MSAYAFAYRRARALSSVRGSFKLALQRGGRLGGRFATDVGLSR